MINEYINELVAYGLNQGLVDPEDEVYVELGKVMVMARVWLNGKYVGGVWTYPYRLNIKKYLREVILMLKV